MSSMVSIILVFMLTIGGSPVVPGNSADSFNISEKPLLGAKKIFPGVSIKKITENQHPIKEKQILNFKLHRNLYYGYNRIHLHTFEQRFHQDNKGDLYNYDEIQRLTIVKFNVPQAELENPGTIQFEKQKSITFDKVENILKLITTEGTETTEVNSTMAGVNAQLNQYTTFGEWGLSYDLNGNTTNKGTQEYSYDYRNQMVFAKDNITNDTVQYRYDPFGRRISKEVTTTAGSNLTKYFYHDHQVIEERDGSDQVQKQYVYGNGIDEVLRVDRKEGDTMVPYYYHSNGIGSITAITDNDGNVIERYSYDLYGMPTITDSNGDTISTSSIGNEYMFQGRRYEKDTNLYHYRARAFDPIMGRFLQTDPMGYKDSMIDIQRNSPGNQNPWQNNKAFLCLQRSKRRDKHMNYYSYFKAFTGFVMAVLMA